LRAQVNNRLMGHTEKTDMPRDVVIGAGVGGLCAAIALASAGRGVTVIEAQAHLGGKIRTLPSEAGPVDTGPTVLTLPDVFETLFARSGARMADYVTLIPQPILARHFWPDGAQLDLFSDSAANAQAIGRFAGAQAARDYLRFDRLTGDMYRAFDGPMMRARQPQLGSIALAAAQRPAIWPALLPMMSLSRWLAGQFSDPRLVQLFGRYATYVGGAPQKSPAVLGLIWQAEAAGVWAVQGGMAALAAGLARLAREKGVQFRCGIAAQHIAVNDGRATAVRLADGSEILARSITFNGDPAALAAGLLGPMAQGAVRASATRPRSLSAYVWAFAAQINGGAPDLIHHNVFFGSNPAQDFGAIARGQMARDPTLYICAQDRRSLEAPNSAERFEIIMNAAPLRAGTTPSPDETDQCQTEMLAQLSRFNLRFQTPPPRAALTTPQGWAGLFPASMGAIYGRSPQSLLAPMLRPTAQTRVKGLFLAGGGAHPGAGVPMAALSGQHAAAAILNDPISP
jgi:1-hydroxycarotenoid 3,4-desaturase